MSDRQLVFSKILKGDSVDGGDFSTRQTVPCHDLVLSIGTDLPVRFPFTKTQVRTLIKQAKPARFGLKDQTLHDTRVRDTWEIPKSRIKIDKKQWNKTLKPLLDSVAVDLGLAEGSTFDAHLHNLLIYEPGQFFLPHQDTEKVDGMVATLVVVLPSSHKGGALMIDHGGEKRTVQSCRTRLDTLTCIAFYADCHHEVKPVTEGYRVALTYNLVLKNAPSAKVQTPDKKPLVKALSEYFDDADKANQALLEEPRSTWYSPRPPKWIFLLDHQYTQKSLDVSQLKNHDRQRFQLIRQAAESLECDVDLGLLELQEIWDAYAEDEIFDRHGRSLGRSSDDDDAFELNGLIDSAVTLTFVAGSSAKLTGSLNIRLEREQLFWVTPCEAFDPFSSEYEGWMGNYGNTLERRYHRACVLLTRKSDQYAAMCETDPRTLVKTLQKFADREATRSKAREIITSILPYWAKAHDRNTHTQTAWVNAVLKLSRSIQDDTLALKLNSPLTLRALNSKTAKAFSLCTHEYGDHFAGQLLDEWQKNSDRYGNRHLASFAVLIEQLKKEDASEKVLTRFMHHQFDSLISHFNDEAKRSPVTIKEKASDRLALTAGFLDACVITGNPQFLQKMTAYTEAQPLLFPLLERSELLFQVMAPGVIKNHPGYLTLYRSTFDGLQKAVSAPPRQKDNWSIPDKVNCDCDLCTTLSEFLIHTEQQSMVWPIAKASRQHIHNTIGEMGLPVTHVTRREGSPHKLVLNKTAKLHTQAKKQRAAEEEAYKKIQLLVVD